MLLIRGGRIFDPLQPGFYQGDVLIDGSKVVAVGPGLDKERGMEIMEADGLIVSPGLIDMHVHLRDPGFVAKEDIASGLEAAAAGGFAAVMAMPNTAPVCDSAVIVRYLYEKAAGIEGARLMVCGSISKGLEGRELSLIGDMAEAGVVALSDDGRTVSNPELMRLAMLYAQRFNLPIVAHCLDTDLAGEGVMHLGPVSMRLGLKGIPGSAEDIIVARDLLLAEETGARLHLAHLSTAVSLDLLRRALQRGCRVTAEVTPHHLTLTDEAVEGYDTSTKVSPPLRSETDRQALASGLAEGVIGVIATDHAPHTPDEKAVEYDLAPVGLIGMETALPVLLTALVHSGIVPMERVLQALTSGPARALGLAGGILVAEAPADITIIDPDDEHVINPDSFRSRSRNTPFAGWKVRGRAVSVIVGGQRVYRR